MQLSLEKKYYLIPERVYTYESEAGKSFCKNAEESHWGW